MNVIYWFAVELPFRVHSFQLASETLELCGGSKDFFERYEYGGLPWLALWRRRKIPMLERITLPSNTSAWNRRIDALPCNCRWANNCIQHITRRRSSETKKIGVKYWAWPLTLTSYMVNQTICHSVNLCSPTNVWYTQDICLIYPRYKLVSKVYCHAPKY